MVFEQLFKFKHIQHNSLNLFIMGFIFSELGILSSLLVFRADAHLMSIAFTAAIAVPFLFNILEIKNIEVSGEQSFFKAVFNNNKYIFNSYLMLFLGFLLSYAIFAMLLPDFITLSLFRGQLNVAGLAGGVIAALGFAVKQVTFGSILQNNLGVLLVCFLFSIVFGVGSILFLIWNASAWGAILGYISKQSALVIGQNPIVYFFNQLIKYFPHLIVEAAAYFFAIMAGVVVSQTLINEKFNSDTFRLTMLEGLFLFMIGIVLLVVAAFIEVKIFPYF
jgi:uncharacterized membrane protein SpoIIM required for sporulation